MPDVERLVREYAHSSNPIALEEVLLRGHARRRRSRRNRATAGVLACLVLLGGSIVAGRVLKREPTTTVATDQVGLESPASVVAFGADGAVVYDAATLKPIRAV